MFKNILDVNLLGWFDNIMLIGFKGQLDPTTVLGTESICSEYRTLTAFTLGWANSLKNNLEAKAPWTQCNQKGSETSWDLFPLFGGRTCPVCIAQHLAVCHRWNLSAQEQTCFCFGEKPRADTTDARWHVYCPQTPELESVGPQRQGKRLLPADLCIPASAVKTREPTWILHVEPCPLPGWKQSLLSLHLFTICAFSWPPVAMSIWCSVGLSYTNIGHLCLFSYPLMIFVCPSLQLFASCVHHLIQMACSLPMSLQLRSIQ